MKTYDLFLFDGLTEAQKADCREMAATDERTYSKGETIYDDTRARRALALVLEGAVQVFHGKVVMNTLTAGDIFGVAALFGQGEPYPTRVAAKTECRVCLIPQEAVSAWMAAYPQVAENYVCFLSDRIRFLNRRLGTLTAGAAESKLWRYLLAHADASGRVSPPGGMSELAKSLGVGRSSLYRSLDTLAAEGKLTREEKSILLTKGARE